MEERIEETLATISQSEIVADSLPFSEPLEKPTTTRRVKAGPAALYHWEKSHCRITDMQIEEINKVVTDLPKWQKMVDEWLLHGFSPKNVGGPLGWYKNGLPTWGKKPASRETQYEAVAGSGIVAGSTVAGSQERAAELAEMGLF
jgi:hypothetical protein